jgi:hypothetical protein
MTSRNVFCANCGIAGSAGAKYCASCGNAFESAGTPTPRKGKQRRSSPIAVIALTLLVIVGGLYLLNNTVMGLSIRCHVLGDYGACLLESFTEPGPVENVLHDIGASV